MSLPRQQLITPPSEEEVIYPYRRAWNSIGLEGGIFFSVVLAIMVIATLVDIPQQYWLSLGVLIAATPLVLWSVISWVRERLALEPREHIFAVFVLAVLVANGVGYPLTAEILRVDEWATQQEITTRIVVLTLANGIIPETLKYLVLRYTVWLNGYRNRYDAVAYAATSAIGYATVLNVHYLIDSVPPPDVAAIRIFGTTALHLVGSVIVAYGMAEIRFDKTSPLLTPGMISLASLVIGLVSSLRGNIANTSISSLIQVNEPRLLFNFAISGLVLLAVCLAMAFLFSTTERQAQEAEKEPDS